MREGKDIIRIENLDKSFGNVHAVNNLTLQVKEGELFAFLGVNGAGKSTTISIMCGLLQKDGGNVYIDDKDIDKDSTSISKNIGVVFQNSALDKNLTVYENLLSRASLYGIYEDVAKKKISELANILDFKDILYRQLGNLSGGQKRKIDVARALIHNPKLLILDEPTTGLDPQTRKTLWKVIDEFRKKRNMTVFLTTHYMEEAVDADYVVILDTGRVVAEGTPLELKNNYTGDFISLYNVDKKDIEKLGKRFEKINGGFRIFVNNTKEARDIIISNPSLFTDFELIKGKMDDVFLAVTGKQLNGGE